MFKPIGTDHIFKIVEDRILDGEKIYVDAVTTSYLIEVCEESPLAGGWRQGEHEIYSLLWDAARRAVGVVLRKFRPDADGESQQLRLPGCDQVQLAYTIKEEGEWVTIPTHLLTLEQALAIADSLDKEAEAKRSHAKELRRWAIANLKSATPA